MISLFYFLTMLSCLLGGVVLTVGVLSSSGAPQQAAAGAIGAALAVIPYVFTRCAQIVADRKEAVETRALVLVALKELTSEVRMLRRSSPP